jgi:hypothetical protein
MFGSQSSHGDFVPHPTSLVSNTTDQPYTFIAYSPRSSHQSPDGMMRTRRQSSPTLLGQETPSIPTSPKAVWELADETRLIEFLLSRRETGETSFSADTWNAAEAHLRPVLTKGAPKNADSCKTKWRRVRSCHSDDHDYIILIIYLQLKELYDNTTRLRNLSGISWTNEAANVVDITCDAWKSYVAVSNSRFGKIFRVLISS